MSFILINNLMLMKLARLPILLFTSRWHPCFHVLDIDSKHYNVMRKRKSWISVLIK